MYDIWNDVILSDQKDKQENKGDKKYNIEDPFHITVAVSKDKNNVIPMILIICIFRLYHSNPL